MRYWGQNIRVVTVKDVSNMVLYVGGDMDIREAKALALSYLREKKKMAVTESSLQWATKIMLTDMNKDGEV